MFYVAWTTHPAPVDDISAFLSPAATWAEVLRASKTNKWCTCHQIASADSGNPTLTFKMTIKLGKSLGMPEMYRVRPNFRGGDFDGGDPNISPAEWVVGYLWMLTSDGNNASGDKRLALDAIANIHVTMYGKELETD